MFRKMRRINQQLSDDECRRLLCGATSGVLALAGDGGYPYAVPLSYVFDGDKVYFHCAKSGHKLDSIRREPKASFCIIAADNVLPEKFTTLYESVILFGRITEVHDEREIKAAAIKLAQKYSPDKTRQQTDAEIERYKNSLCILAMSIEHMSGKKARELI